MELALFALAAGIVIAALILALVPRRQAPVEPARPDPRMDTVLAAQGEITGRFQQTIAAQAELQRAISERIDALNKRLGDTLSETASKSADLMGGIQTRLTVIDEAQKNIAALSGQVVSLQEILSDKQTRGAFGQERMEAIIADQMAPDQYDFQFTLSNGKRPDCVIRIPNVRGVIVVDSKFPLEAFEALRGLSSEEDRKRAMAQLRSDVQKHVRDIADKYLIPGEVQTPAIMFVPSESIYAELYTSFGDIVQQARRQQVVIMSPHVLMLAINTIQTLMKNAKMREQADEIQKEVGLLLQDVKRLGERVGNLRAHFDRTNKDIGEIETSMRGIDRHAERIGEVKLTPPETLPPPGT
ncbi:MAG TPA: DNA recombination protein RmuC [Rhizomicrobium sp.]|nr:DNA recombination protein RmuC [Rhizomicrobium sp.]